jgi:hypothetical protein
LCPYLKSFVIALIKYSLVWVLFCIQINLFFPFAKDKQIDLLTVFMNGTAVPFSLTTVCILSINAIYQWAAKLQ